MDHGYVSTVKNSMCTKTGHSCIATKDLQDFVMQL